MDIQTQNSIRDELLIIEVLPHFYCQGLVIIKLFNLVISGKMKNKQTLSMNFFLKKIVIIFCSVN